ncbi:MAG TPA: YfiR family protein [Luteitalea sp.]|nr:YfiR family protein [Luteitalea sp.]
MTRQAFIHRMWSIARTALAVGMVGGLVGTGRADGATRVADHAVRADTIVQMLRFVEWSGSGPARALRVAVVGNDTLATALRDACASLQPGGRSAHIFVVATPRAAVEARADVVVLGAMPTVEARLIATELGGRGILTVGDGDCPDTPHLALNLLAEGPRYRVAANPAAAARAGVGLSSRLLRLAHIVGD